MSLTHRMALNKRRGVSVQLPSGIDATDIAEGDAYAYVSFSPTGTWQTNSTGATPWLLSGAASDCEIHFLKTAQTGTGFAGVAVNTWFSLTSGASWDIEKFSNVCTVEGIIRIRQAGTTTNLASATVTMMADAR